MKVWRLFGLAVEDVPLIRLNAWLVAPYYHDMCQPGTIWSRFLPRPDFFRFDGPTGTASCTENPRHAPPVERCACGIYGVRRRHLLTAVAVGACAMRVEAEVELTGPILPDPVLPWGVRGAGYRLLALYPPDDTPADVRRALEKRYGVPVHASQVAEL